MFANRKIHERDLNTIERKNSTEFKHRYAELCVLCVMCIVVERRSERMNFVVETSNEVGKATSLGRQRSLDKSHNLFFARFFFYFQCNANRQ